MGSIGLHMIIKPGEGRLLERCLQSFQAERFTQVCVGVTGVDTDNEIQEHCPSYVELIDVPWVDDEYPFGNFGRARDTVLKSMTTSYVMWLDADDICPTNEIERLWNALDNIVCSEENSHVMAYFIEYALVVNPNTFDTEVSFLKERIFKRCNLFKWKRAVHESFCDNWEDVTHGVLRGPRIVHLPSKPQYTSALRNVEILKHEHKKNPADATILFFLARDLLMAGEMSTGIQMFWEIVNRMEDRPQNLYYGCITVAMYYAYGGSPPRPSLDDFRKDSVRQIETWVRLALGFSFDYAEPYVILGDLDMLTGNTQHAERMYATALKKKLGTGAMQLEPFYEEVPASRLSDIHVGRGNLEQALWYNMRARLHNSGEASLVVKQRHIIKELAHGIGADPIKTSVATSPVANHDQQRIQY